MNLKYNWLGVDRDVILEEYAPDTYHVQLIRDGDGQPYMMGGMEKAATGLYTAYAKGQFFKGTKDEAVLQLMEFMEQQQKNQIADYNRIKERAAEREAARKEREERERAFE